MGYSYPTCDLRCDHPDGKPLDSEFNYNNYHRHCWA